MVSYNAVTDVPLARIQENEVSNSQEDAPCIGSILQITLDDLVLGYEPHPQEAHALPFFGVWCIIPQGDRLSNCRAVVILSLLRPYNDSCKSVQRLPLYAEE
jgi:hypothetical protein